MESKDMGSGSTYHIGSGLLKQGFSFSLNEEVGRF